MRKICVFTGTRAEYGLLRNLMAELRDATSITLQIIASGTHLTTKYGNTVDEIERDGFQIDETVDMLLASDTSRAVGTSVGIGVIGLTNALSRLGPDILVVLGDRYEAFAAAQSAMILGIPIAHIHGGEATEGVIDEAIRHSISKMSHIHFVAAEPYKRRVIQLGEQPETVHLVGATGLDNISGDNLLSREMLEKFIGLKLSHPLFLVTYHPVTLERNGGEAVDILFEALGFFPEATIVFTGSNADPNGASIDRKIQDYCAAKPDRARHFISLGFRRYLSLMSLADVVIGNSSSGILEAPTIGVPTVNIGPRQRGRLRAPAVIDVNETVSSIREGINEALGDNLRVIAARRKSPFGRPGAAKRIADVLRQVELDGILMKRFYDL